MMRLGWIGLLLSGCLHTPTGGSEDAPVLSSDAGGEVDAASADADAGESPPAVEFEGILAAALAEPAEGTVPGEATEGLPELSEAQLSESATRESAPRESAPRESAPRESALLEAPPEGTPSSPPTAPQEVVPVVRIGDEHGDRYRITGHHALPELCALVRQHAARSYGEMHCERFAEVDGYTFLEVGTSPDMTIVLLTEEGNDTYLAPVAYSRWGVNYDETATLLSVSSVQDWPDRIELRFRHQGEGSACTEPVTYTSRSQEIVVCDLGDRAAIRCTDEIPIRGRTVERRFSYETDREGPPRLVESYRVRVRHTDAGIRFKESRGRLPSHFRYRYGDDTGGPLEAPFRDL
ncbi:MAG: hypothetical protein AAGF12_26180 [Myxococcota bacterium]